MNNSDKIWLSRESYETLFHAFQNIQIRQTPAVMTPSATFSGTGKSAVLFLDFPETKSSPSGEYMSYFKIVDRSSYIKENEELPPEKRLFRIAVCDGATYDEEKGTSDASIFYINENMSVQYIFPYRESEIFGAENITRYSPYHVVVLYKHPEKEYSLIVDFEDKYSNSFTYDPATGSLTLRKRIGRIQFPEYDKKTGKTGEMKIIQDHLTGPANFYWLVDCFSIQNNLEYEE